MRRVGFVTLLTALSVTAGHTHAQISDGIVKFGVLNDESGPYATLAGTGSRVAALMAVEDFGAAAKGLTVEIVFADHQNKVDIGSSIARKWYETDKVDVIVDVPNSSVALAVNQIARDKGKAFLNTGAASSDLTGRACSPNTIHWTYDTWALANGTARAIVTTGGDTWVFLTANYTFGLTLERDTEAVVVAHGGKVLGRIRHPFPTSDFSSFLLEAQASQAKIIGLANAGADTTNAIEQGTRLGIVQGGQHFAGLLVFLTDVHALGLNTTAPRARRPRDSSGRSFAACIHGIFPSRGPTASSWPSTSKRRRPSGSPCPARYSSARTSFDDEGPGGARVALQEVRGCPDPARWRCAPPEQPRQSLLLVPGNQAGADPARAPAGAGCGRSHRAVRHGDRAAGTQGDGGAVQRFRDGTRAARDRLLPPPP
jgi:hypothetical protein